MSGRKSKVWDHFEKVKDEPKYEYALRHLYALVNLCERGYSADSIQLAMDSVCRFRF